MTMHQSNLEQLTTGLKTKSEKIRTLARHGANTAEIARFLQIRYQHARNVLKQADLTPSRRSEAVQKEEVSHLKSIWLETQPECDLRIPASFLSALNLRESEPVLVRHKNGILEIIPREAAWKQVQAMVKEKVPEHISLVDELIAERRAEAKDEE
jgi:antitoxin component of MazEF toxin-antitoxin module